MVQDVRVIQRGCCTRLGKKPRPSLVVLRPTRQELQCDVAIEAYVACPVDDSHGATAKLSDDIVM